MLAAQLIQNSFPSLHLHDKAAFALQLMEDYEVQHLPVVSDEKLVGLVAKDDLLDIDADTVVAALADLLLQVSVKKEAHFLVAIHLLTSKDVSLIAVVNENQVFLGTITATVLLQSASTYLGNEEPGGVVVLEVERRNYSFGEISRLVETNDAYITQLNTYPDVNTGVVVVTIKINKIEISDIIATFQRYDYVVRYYFGEESYTNELKENYNHLMAYLNI